ncbi:MAG TPA: multicopper oxidase family protein [Micromonosporaceae bacterium]
MTRPISRRAVLRGGLVAAGGAVLAACVPEAEPPAGEFVAPDGEQVRVAEARRNPGQVREVRLSAVAGPVDLGGLTVATWSYGGTVPGTAIRVRAGEVLKAVVDNRLPADTSVHWHGVAMRNNADGVPGLTQPAIGAGTSYTYQFTVPHPGTYWFHPHTGVQLDRGLYAPLIVDDPAEPGRYDDEWIVVLDDWLDGVTGTPDEVLAELRQGMGGMHGGGMMSGGGHMMMGATSSLLGGDAGDVRYPYFLLNGRVAAAPVTLTGRPGSRVRIRFVNAGADTAFRVALGGHEMVVTHSDGFAVQPTGTDALLIGMGERYDVQVTLGDGAFPLVALAEGKGSAAFGLVRTGAGAAPAAGVRPAELDRRIVAYRQLRPADGVGLAQRQPDRNLTLKLTGGMMAYDWGINGRPHDPRHFEPVRSGERVRLDLVNTTMMWHPIHLHGHTFATERTGVRKDTIIVLPGQRVPVVFDADNPGRWMLHCHNIYHAESGMMTQLGYLR